ncbi:hypothetical protein BJ508DRAFT_78918 [Ascobolus immersus RN42]|uniref:histidine kinase n=1 Tax=Ascobolus immersus RN42 TaxID=1160509 RepID=A0A3N4IEK1_ASCIM|nr:hypothetical protein BJ508DRAFT_78918 [Ascobolus immersus RN42]
MVTRMLDARRCIVTMTGSGLSYVIAESTRTLSLRYPHTHAPGDQLMLGGGSATASMDGLCEHTISLLPPPPDSDEPFLLEIPDLARHPKYFNAGYVRGWPHGRFYCGAPLRTKNGVSIGTVCVMDDRPRYNGLTPEERVQMASMADIFMNYLEKKQSDTEKQRGQLMEMELSRFIAEGFMPTEGATMAERRDGRLWSETILQERRQKELQRRKQVEEKRQIFQERQFAEMVKQQKERERVEEEMRREAMRPDTVMTAILSKEGKQITTITTLDPRRPFDGSSQQISRSDSDETFMSARSEAMNSWSPKSQMSEPPVMIAHIRPRQPGLIELRNARASEDVEDDGFVSLADTLTAVPRSDNPSGLEQVSFEAEACASSASSTSGFSRSTVAEDATQATSPDPPEVIASPESIMRDGSPSRETDETRPTSGTIGSELAPEDFASIGTAETTMGGTWEQESTRRRSNYEQTASVEPHFRAIFSRAASLIRSTIQAEVVFLDGDLEGYFEVDGSDGDNSASNNGWGFSHASTDPDVEAMTRASRPAAHRQRTGVLGYATAGGSSLHPRSKQVRDGYKSLGFDVSQLDETLLNQIVEENYDGQIIAFVDEYPGLSEERSEFQATEKIIAAFLPGVKCAIIMPLFDHNRKLLSVCFAWTTLSTKVFIGESEGRFVRGIASSIMNEVTRLNILNADKAKSEFISSISHELRSPLHGILASANFLAEGNLDQDQRAFVGTIISCGTTLLDTVNHVLDFQKLNYLQDRKLVAMEGDGSTDGRVLDTINEDVESQESVSSSIPVATSLVETDLSTLIQEVTDGVALGYEFKGFSTPSIGDGAGAATFMRSMSSATKTETVTVIVDVDRRVNGWNFLLNPAAFKRIINNLVGNAFKYNREKGWIRISLTAEDMPDDALRGCKRAKVKLTVADSGRGISREFLKTRLFTPFSQENPLSAGAGLGMCIVRQLVGMMEGNIDIKSRAGRGTTVTIETVLVHKSPTYGQPTPHNEIDIRSFRGKTEGKRALLVGFDTWEVSPNLEPYQQAANYLRESISNYCRQYFGLHLLDDGHPDRAEDKLADFIIVNESTLETRRRLGKLSNESDTLRRVPVVVLCTRSPADTPSGQKLFPYKNPHYSITFSRKPCGPKKLAKALRFCLDKVDEQKDATVEALNEKLKSMKGEAPRRIQLPQDDPIFRAMGSPVTPLSNPFDDLFSSASTRSGRTSKQTTPITVIDTGATPKPIFWAGSQPLPQPLTQVVLPKKITIPPSSKPAAQDGGKKMSILVVEDNHINMMLLTTYLRRNKYQYDTAVNGLEALNKVKAHESEGGYDAILMDLQMPVLSGIEATREIRIHENNNPTIFKRSFIVALTGLAASSERRDAFDAGINAFMVKPVNFKELEKLLGEHVGFDGEKIKLVSESLADETELGGLKAASESEDNSSETEH